jgi:hypothetical protein
MEAQVSGQVIEAGAAGVGICLARAGGCGKGWGESNWEHIRAWQQLLILKDVFTHYAACIPRTVRTTGRLGS